MSNNNTRGLWVGSITAGNKNRINMMIRKAGSVTGLNLDSLEVSGFLMEEVCQTLVYHTGSILYMLKYYGLPVQCCST